MAAVGGYGLQVYVARRVLLALPVLVGVSLLVFGVMRLAPGDPAAIMLGAQSTKEDVERLRRDLGLDRPVAVQYLQWMGRVVQGDLGLVHRLQKARLGLGGGSVDLVSKDDVGEEGARLELELPLPGIVDGHAEDVGRQQVAGKLDPLEAATEGLCECLGEHGLPDPRDVLNQEVSSGQQRDDR